MLEVVDAVLLLRKPFFGFACFADCVPFTMYLRLTLVEATSVGASTSVVTVVCTIVVVTETGWLLLALRDLKDEEADAEEAEREVEEEGAALTSAIAVASTVRK